MCVSDAAKIHNGIFQTQTQQLLFWAWGSKLEQRYGWLFGLHVWLLRIPSLQKQYGNNNRHCCFRFNVGRFDGMRGRGWILVYRLFAAHFSSPSVQPKMRMLHASACTQWLIWHEMKHTIHWFWYAQMVQNGLFTFICTIYNIDHHVRCTDEASALCMSDNQEWKFRV